MTALRRLLTAYRNHKSAKAYAWKQAAFDKREADALRRGSTQAVGAVRAERRAFVNAALRGAK